MFIRGFSVIEIIVVIAVIAILATFTSIGYGVVSQQSRDTQRRTDLEALANAIKSWANDTAKKPIETGAGYGGFGEGYVRGSAPDYPQNIDDVLSSGGYLSREIADPKTPTGVGSYMFYSCKKANYYNKIYAFFAKLELPTEKDTATIVDWQSNGCTTEPLNALYGMNYTHKFIHEF